MSVDPDKLKQCKSAPKFFHNGRRDHKFMKVKHEFNAAK